MTLDQLPVGQSAVIARLKLEAARATALMEMGLMEGVKVTLIRKAPLGDPLELQVGDFRLSLRKEEASGIELEA